MLVPFIDLKRQLGPIREAVLADWRTCLDETQFVGGAMVSRFEADMRTALAVPHFVSCANGTDALLIALQAAGMKPGMRVAVPNLTFWATYEAVVQAGCEAVLIDIDSDDLQMSYDEFVAAHAQYKFDAAILVHLMGWCSSRLGDFRKFSERNGVVLIEDGAQAFGVRSAGVPVFSGARLATLSFYPAKVLGGAMDGGGITMQSAAEESLARILCNHGRASHYSFSHVGWNSRMSSLQAAFLGRLLATSNELLASRRAAAAAYRKLIAELLPGAVRHYAPPTGVEENAYLVVLAAKGHAGGAVSKRLREVGIGSANTYPETIDAQPPARESLRVSDLSNSKQFCRSVFNLPMFTGITQDEVHRSVSALKQLLRGDEGASL